MSEQQQQQQQEELDSSSIAKPKQVISKEALAQLAAVQTQVHEELSGIYQQVEEAVEKARLKTSKILKTERMRIRGSEERDGEESKQSVSQFPAKIELDVGGFLYATTVETLRAVPGSILDLLFSGNYEFVPDGNGRYFIDRNGEFFDYILDFLRDGSVQLPDEEHQSRQFILHEARFYGIDLLSSEQEQDEENGDNGNENSSSSAKANWTLVPAVGKR